MSVLSRLLPKPSLQSPLSLAWLAAIWMGALCNWPLWQRMLQLPELGNLRGKFFVLAFALIVIGGTGALMSLLAWRRSIKPLLILLLPTAAGLAHFMGSYGIVMDADMLTNVLQTDPREVRDLLTPGLFLSLALLGLLPLVWLLRQPLRRDERWTRRAGWNLLGLLGGVLLALAALMSAFADFASTMRNHKSLRYMVNPLNAVYAVVNTLHGQGGGKSLGPLRPLGEDAKSLGHSGKPPLLMMVVGETARAANFSLNGYGRATNPMLAQRGVLSFRDVKACGTSTAASLPCMFSPLGREAHLDNGKQPQENVLDMLHRAGLAVLWLDNQSGCKGLCERIPNAQAGDYPKLPAGLCGSDGECLDEALLPGLDERLAALDPERRARGVVLVLHQMGSHGPAYYKRSPKSAKPFQPECESSALQHCPREALLNTYDNSIAYTDRVLAGAIDWLRTQEKSYQPALLYVSDHGESLGENNLYLHGMPYAVAPREQVHVPMIWWMPQGSEPALGLKPGCLAGRLDQALSHDVLAHTLLGYSRVSSKLYRPDWDLLQPCRG